MEYSNSQIRELIGEYIHNVEDREMLQLRLIDGRTFGQIVQIIHENGGPLYEEKTVRTRVHKGETIIFKHIPG